MATPFGRLIGAVVSGIVPTFLLFNFLSTILYTSFFSFAADGLTPWLGARRGVCSFRLCLGAFGDISLSGSCDIYLCWYFSGDVSVRMLVLFVN